MQLSRPLPTLTPLRVLASALVFVALLGVESLSTAQGPATVWVADDVSDINLGDPLCIRYPRVNGFDFALDGTPMVGWTQLEGCSGSNETHWSEKLQDGWHKRTWDYGDFWGSGPGGAAHEFAMGLDGRPYLFMVGGNSGSLTYHTYMADLRAYADGEPGALSWTGEHVGNHQECVYVRYKVAAGPGQAWPYRVTARGHCNNLGPFRFEGQALTADQITRGFDLAIGPDGQAHLAYIAVDGKVMYMRPGGTPVQVATVNYYSDEVAIQAGSNGTVHIVARGLGFTSEHDRGLLAYLRSTDNGATWTHVDNADASRVTYGLSLQLDPSGEPAVAYWRYGQGLYYSSRASGAWVGSRVVNPGWSGVQWVKAPYVRFDATGVPHIAYYDWSANRIRISSPALAGVEPPVDLYIQGNASPNPTAAGTQVTYTLTVGNTSAREASGVRVQATLPPGATAGTFSPAPLTNSGGVLTFDTWRIRGGGTGQDRLPAGATGTITFNVSGLTTGVSELPVVVTSAEADAEVADNSTIVTARINEATCGLPVSGRTAWWPGDGTALNYGSGPAYHGTPVGGVSYGPGAVGQAFVLDGTGYIKVPNGWPEQYWPGTGATSVAAWFSTEVTTTAAKVIASMDDMAHMSCCGSPQGHAAWYLYVQNGVVMGSLRDSVYGSGSVVLTGTTPVADGQFHHAALVIDTPTLQAHLYVNGAVEATAPLRAGWAMNWGDYQSEELVIGASQVLWADGYQYFFNGVVDDVALYKRVLTPVEIANTASGARRIECGAVPVVLESPGDQAGDEGDVVSLSLTAAVGEGRAAHFDATGLPPGLSMAAGTGVITGTIAEGSAGTHAVTVRLSDGLTEATTTFVWTVTVPPLPVLTLHAGAGAILTVLETGAQCVGGEAELMFDRTCALEVPAGTYTVQGTTSLSMSRLRWHWTLQAPHEVPAEADRVTVLVVEATEIGGALLGTFVVERVWEEGGGPGTVTSSLPPYVAGQQGFGCGAGAKCVGEARLGTTVTLTAGAAGDNIFASWSRACEGTNPVCALFIDPLIYVRELSMPLVDAHFMVYEPPQLTSPGDQHSYEGETIALPLAWSVGDGKIVAFMATGLPPGLTIDPHTGVISGTLTMESSGSFHVTVTISDAVRDTSVTWWWFVDDMNQDPIAVDDALEIERNTPTFTIQAAQLLANDSDPDGDALFIIAVGGSTNGRAVLREDGNIDFTVNPVFHGTASFVYDVSDGRGGSAPANVVITVTLVNEDPIGVDDSAVTLGGPVTINVLANDSDPDGDLLTITGITVLPTKGTAVVVGTAITYSPTRMVYDGTDTFTYTISDGLGGTASATVTITTPAGEMADVQVTVAGVGRDSESGIPLVLVRVKNVGPAMEPRIEFQSSAEPGVATVLGALIVSQVPGASCVPPSGEQASCTILNLAPGAEVTIGVRATPTTTNSPRTFSLSAFAVGEVIDPDYANNGTTAPVTIPLSTSDLAVALEASSGSYRVEESVTFTARVSNNGPDQSVTAALTITLDGAGTTSSAQCSASGLTNGQQTWFCSVPSLAPGDTWTVAFDQVAFVAGTRVNRAQLDVAPMAIWMTDPVAGNNAVELITEARLNQLPSFAVVDHVGDIGNSAHLRILVIDPDHDDLEFTVVGLPPGVSSVAHPDGMPTDPRPYIDISGVLEVVGTYTVTVSVSDGRGTVTKTFTWTVRPANRPPVARDDHLRAHSFLLIPVLGNDDDPDGDPLTIVDVTAAGKGQVAIHGDSHIAYTPPGDARWLSDSFAYTISDGRGGTASAVVSIAQVSLGVDMHVAIAPIAPVPGGTEFTLSVALTNIGSDVAANVRLILESDCSLEILGEGGPGTLCSLETPLGTFQSAESRTLAWRFRAPNQEGLYPVTARVELDGSDAYTEDNTASRLVPVQPQFCFTPASELRALYRAEGLLTSEPAIGAPQGSEHFAPSRTGQAFLFEGAEWLHLRTGAPRTRTFSVSAWVARGDQGGDAPVLADTTRYWLGFEAGRPVFNLYANGARIGQLIADAVVSPQEWVHLAATYDNGVAHLYVNGTLAALASGLHLAYGPNAMAEDLRVGELAFGEADYWDPTRFVGRIDDIALHDRALTAEEVARMVNGNAIACAVSATPALALTVVPDPEVSQSEGLVTFTATVTNVGDGYLPAVEVTHVPAVQGRAVDALRTAVGPLLAGESRSVIMRVTAPVADGRYQHGATAMDAGFGVRAATDTGFTVASEGCFVPATGLLAHWRGEPGDLSAPPLLAWNEPVAHVPGRVGMTFEPGNHFAAPDQTFILGGPFTVGGWVKSDADRFYDGWQALVAVVPGHNRTLDPTGEARVFLGLIDGVPTLVTTTGGVQVTTQPAGLTPVVEERWVHLAASYDGTSVRLYVDGHLTAAKLLDHPIDAPGASELLLLGVGLMGLFDEVLVYDRAVTDDEAERWVAGRDDCAINSWPVPTNPGPQRARVGDLIDLELEAMDPDPGDELTWFASGLPAGLTIDSRTGRITGTVLPEGSGPSVTSVTLSDGRLSMTETFEWIIPHRITYRVSRGSTLRVLGDDPLDCDASLADVICETHVEHGFQQPPIGSVTPDLRLWTTYTIPGQAPSRFASQPVTSSWVVDVEWLGLFRLDLVGLATTELEHRIVFADAHQPERDRVHCWSVGFDAGYCEGQALLGTTVTVTEYVDPFRVLTGWSGACAGTDCTLVMGTDKLEATGVWERRSVPLTLNVGPGGTVDVVVAATEEVLAQCDGGTTGATCMVPVWSQGKIELRPSMAAGPPRMWQWTSVGVVNGSFHGNADASFSVTQPATVDVKFLAWVTVHQGRWVAGAPYNGTRPLFAGPVGWTCHHYAAKAWCEMPAVIGSTLVLTDDPLQDTRVMSWEGACEGSGECAVTVTGPTDIVARVGHAVTFDVGPGGTITVGGRSCGDPATGAMCTFVLDVDEPSSLTAEPLVDEFRDWWANAPIQGTGLEQTVVFGERKKTVQTRFYVPFSISDNTNGETPKVTVIGDVLYNLFERPIAGLFGTQVRFEPEPRESDSFRFQEWAPATFWGPTACVGTGECVVTMDRAGIRVLAQFNRAPRVHSDYLVLPSAFIGEVRKNTPPFVLRPEMFFVDPDGDALTFTEVVVETPGIFDMTLTADGLIVVAPLLDASGTVYFRVEVTDSAGLSISQRFHYRVTAVNFLSLDPIPDTSIVSGRPSVIPLRVSPLLPNQQREIIAAVRSLTGEYYGPEGQVTGPISVVDEQLVLHPPLRSESATVLVTVTVVSDPDIADAMRIVSRNFRLTVLPANTPAGIQQTIVFGGGTPLLQQAVALTFANVTVAGQTTVVDAVGSPPLPSGYVMGDPARIIDIATTAQFAGEVEVCVEYDPLAYKTSDQRLFHYNGTSWTDTTTSNRRDASTVCGTTSHFSPFAVVEPASLDGRLIGNGKLETTGAVHEFHMHVSDGLRQVRPNDRLRYEVTTTDNVTSPGNSAGKGKSAAPEVKTVTRTDKFEAAMIQSVHFYDDPGVSAGKPKAGPKAGVTVDGVWLAGTGTWNGVTGYTFEARAEDRGEPGKGRDTFEITIRSPQGTVVATVDGTITAGNVQTRTVGKR